MAGPGLLAHILVAKFDDHLPLLQTRRDLRPPWRRYPALNSDRLVRPGDPRARAPWQRRSRPACSLLPGYTPMIPQFAYSIRRSKRRARIAVSRKAGSGPMSVTTGPGPGKIRQRSLTSLPPTKRGEHPQKHLKDFRGILQADAYRGFEALYEPDADGVQQISRSRLLGASAPGLSRRLEIYWIRDRERRARPDR